MILLFASTLSASFFFLKLLLLLPASKFSIEEKIALPFALLFYFEVSSPLLSDLIRSEKFLLGFIRDSLSLALLSLSESFSSTLGSVERGVFLRRVLL